MALTDKLTAIGDAIRAKTGGTAALTLPQMAAEIANISGSENITWHQCPEAVRDYLAYVAAHPYPADGYSFSYIGNYAPSSPVVANTKPVGKTVDGATFYDNEPNAAEPFSTANKSGTLTALDKLRWYNTATANARDLGGWSCDGGTVKYGMLVRGALPNAADKVLMAGKIGIKTELQLYGGSDSQYPYEERSLWDIDWYGTNGFIWYSIADSKRDLWKYDLGVIFNSVAHQKPVYFHCGAGKDRTGTIAVMLLGLLGVCQSDIDADYELTSFATGSGAGITARTTGDYANYIAAIRAFPLVGGLTDSFRNRCVSFVLSLGFTVDEINAFRAACISGTPDTIAVNLNTYTVSKSGSHITYDSTVASVEQYQGYTVGLKPAAGYVIENVTVTMGGANASGSFTGKKTMLYRAVTNNLTNCSTSRKDTFAMDGQSYVAQLTAKGEYTLEGAAVTITMGGTDVSAYYSEGTIAIPNVTGNLVITATAVPSAPVNLFDASSANNYTPKYRFNSSNQIVTSPASTNVVVSHLIPVSPGDTVKVVTDTTPSNADVSNLYSFVTLFYDSGESFVSKVYAFKSGTTTYDNEWTFTAPSGNYTQMRIAIPYADLSNIVVTVA